MILAGELMEHFLGGIAPLSHIGTILRPKYEKSIRNQIQVCLLFCVTIAL